MHVLLVNHICSKTDLKSVDQLLLHVQVVIGATLEPRLILPCAVQEVCTTDYSFLVIFWVLLLQFSARNPCEIPYTAGTGNSQLARWYYDYTSRSCIAYQYRGLMGNPNNFLSKEDCEAACPGRVWGRWRFDDVFKPNIFLVWVNPCPSGLPVMGPNNRPQTCDPKSQSSTCPLNYYCLAGPSAETTVCCQGGATLCQLRSFHIKIEFLHSFLVRNNCDEPQNQGQGDYSLPRWFFDPNDRSCKQFTYRGLKGNQNNFVNREDCLRECPVFVNPCPGAGSNNPSQITYCNPSSQSSSCPSNQWCHVGADRDTTLCCPNGMCPLTNETNFYSSISIFCSCWPMYPVAKQRQWSNLFTEVLLRSQCPAVFRIYLQWNWWEPK